MSKMTSFQLALLLALAGARGVAGQNDGAFVIAERGKAAECTIAYAEDADPCVRYAAEELRDYVKRLTGVELTINGKTVRKILLEAGGSRCGMPDDGYAIFCGEDGLNVRGKSSRGCLYGVYDLLERFGGVGFYTSWCEKVPRLDRFAVPQCSIQESPAFAMRESFWYDVVVHHEFGAKLRVNGYNHTSKAASVKFGGDDFRFGGGLGPSHTFNMLCDPNVYFNSHPEYFSLVKGKRKKDCSQLCLTNRDVLEIVVSNVLARIRKDPGAKFYGVSQNDCYNYCECDACKAIDEAEGSHAGTMVRFVNAVAEAVEKEFPDVMIETLAYQYTRKPPKKTRLRPNVVPCLCTIECDFALPILESKYNENVSFRDDIVGWSAQTSNLYIWDYVTNFRNYPMPFANVWTLQDNLRFFKANGARHIFEQGDYEGHHGDFAELKAWLLAKWMWNPEIPLEDLLNDFLPGYYGAGAPYVRKYLDELHRHQQDYSRSGEHPLKIFDSPENPALSDAFLKRALKLWEKALDATKDDPATSCNVKMGAFSVKYMIFERLRTKHDKVAWLSSEPVDEKAVREAQNLGAELLKQMEGGNIALREYERYNTEKMTAWRSFVRRREIGPVQRAEIEEYDLSHEREGRCCCESDDSAAANGRALKLFGSNFDWCGFVRANAIKLDPGATYSIRVRLRVDKVSDGNAFWAGIYDPAMRKDVVSVVRTTAETSSGYRWYEIGTWQATGTEYFWIAPGRFDSGARPAVKDVWLDKIEIRRE